MNSDLLKKLHKILDLSKKTAIKPNVFLEQVVYLIFLKLIDEGVFTDESNHDKVNEVEIFYDQAERFKWRNWIDKSEGEIKDFLKNEVFPYFSSIDNKGKILAEIFNNSTFQIESEAIVHQLLSIINSIDFLNLPYDDRVNLLDYLTTHLLLNGKSQLGNYPTPRIVSKFIVELIQPQGNESIFDPGCGAGTLLTEFYNFNHKNHISTAENAQYHGVDISRSMIRLSILNFILRGAYNFDFYRADYIREQGGIRDITIENKFDIIVAEPPLGIVIPKDEVRDSLDKNIKKIEALFLNAILQNLSNDGIAAIILPDSFLFSNMPDYRELRISMLEKNQIFSVISLPKSVFVHYGVNLNLVIFKKNPSRNTRGVWFCDLSKRKKNVESSFEDIIELWEKFKVSNYTNPPGPKANSVVKSKEELLYWWADKEKIINNDFDLTLNLYKPILEKNDEFDPPYQLIENVKKLNKDVEVSIEKLINDIKNRFN